MKRATRGPMRGAASRGEGGKSEVWSGMEREASERPEGGEVTATGWTGAVEKESGMQRHTDGHQRGRARALLVIYSILVARQGRRRDSRASRKFFPSQHGSQGLEGEGMRVEPTRCPGALSVWAKPSHRRHYFGRSKGRSLAWVAHVTSQFHQPDNTAQACLEDAQSAAAIHIFFPKSHLNPTADLTIFSLFNTRS